MGTTPFGVKVWASLFPFPQFLVAGYLAYTRGSFTATPAGWYVIARSLSFVIGGQVFLRSPFTKMVGPIMHVPFLWVVPASIHWLLTQSGHDANMVRFITYTTILTSISLVADLKTAMTWLAGGKPGYIKSLPQEERVPDMVLVVPSVVMGAIGWLL